MGYNEIVKNIDNIYNEKKEEIRERREFLVNHYLELKSHPNFYHRDYRDEKTVKSFRKALKRSQEYRNKVKNQNEYVNKLLESIELIDNEFSKIVKDKINREIISYYTPTISLGMRLEVTSDELIGKTDKDALEFYGEERLSRHESAIEDTYNEEINLNIAYIDAKNKYLALLEKLETMLNE